MLRFGPFEFEPERYELRRDGEALEVEPQVLEVLSYLVAHRDRVTTKEELVATVWNGRFVTDAAVARAIQKARRVLGDTGDSPIWIETIRGRGYRFVGGVDEGALESGIPPAGETAPTLRESGAREAVETSAHGGSKEAVGPYATAPTTSAISRFPGRRWALGLLFVLVAALASVWWINRHPIGGDRSLPALALAPVPRPSLAVLPLVNGGATDDDDWLSVALARLLVTELAAGDELRLVADETIAVRLEGLDLPEVTQFDASTLSSLRSLFGADFVLAGAFVRPPGSPTLRVDLRLQDALRGESLLAVGESESLENLAVLASRLAAPLRERLGAPRLVEGALPARAALPRDARAARSYATALALARRNDAAQARRELQRVLVIEPGFVPARVALASALRDLGYRNEARQAMATATAALGGLERSQQLEIEALDREMAYDYAGALAPRTALWKFFPDDIEYGLKLAAAQISARQAAAAERTIAELRRLPLAVRGDPRIDLTEAALAREQKDRVRSLELSENAVRKAEELGAKWLLVDGLNEQGAALRNSGRLDDAKSAFSRAHALAVQYGHRAGAAMALYRWGSAYYPSKDFVEADRLTTLALAAFRELDQPSGVGACLMNLGHGRLERGRLPEADQYFSQALTLLRGTGDSESLSVLLSNYLGLRFAEGDWLGALAFAEEGLANERAVKNRFGEADFLYRRGEVLVVLDRFDEATADEKLAAKIFRELGAADRLAVVSNSLGSIASRRGNLEEAVRLHGEAVAGARLAGDRYGVADALNRQANTRFEQGRVGEAIILHREALATFQEMSHRFGVAVVSYGLALDYAAQGKIEEAEPAIAAAVAGFEELGNPPFLAESLRARADLEMARGDLEQAVATLQESRRQLAQRGDDEIERGVRWTEARVALEAGRPAEASSILRELLRDPRATAHPTFEAGVRATLAAVLLDLDDRPGATLAAQRGLALTENIEQAPLRLQVEIVAARVMGVQGRTREAMAGLAAARERAEELDLLPLALHAAYERSQLLLLAGDTEQGEAALAEVGRVARAANLGLWVKKTQRRAL